MANPQTEDGYTEISNELLEAIIKTSMSDYEHRIFWLIIRKTYGYKKKSDWISQKQIIEYTGILKQNVSRTINKLYKKNMIIKEGKNLAIQKDYEKWLPKQVTKSNPNRLPVKEESNPNRLQELSKQITKSNLNRGTQKKNTKENITKENIYSRVKEIKEIILYLNEKAETNYKPTTKKTQELIKARFNEGFTIDDFKTVIDKKIASWAGTEWERFIRPETLFGTKFESYLNEKINKGGISANNGRSPKRFENEREYSDEEQKRIEEKFYA